MAEGGSYVYKCRVRVHKDDLGVESDKTSVALCTSTLEWKGGLEVRYVDGYYISDYVEVPHGLGVEFKYIVDGKADKDAWVAHPWLETVGETGNSCLRGNPVPGLGFCGMLNPDRRCFLHSAFLALHAIKGVREGLLALRGGGEVDGLLVDGRCRGVDELPVRALCREEEAPSPLAWCVAASVLAERLETSDVGPWRSDALHHEVKRARKLEPDRPEDAGLALRYLYQAFLNIGFSETERGAELVEYAGRAFSEALPTRILLAGDAGGYDIVDLDVCRGKESLIVEHSGTGWDPDAFQHVIEHVQLNTDLAPASIILLQGNKTDQYHYATLRFHNPSNEWYLVNDTTIHPVGDSPLLIFGTWKPRIIVFTK